MNDPWEGPEMRIACVAVTLLLALMASRAAAQFPAGSLKWIHDPATGRVWDLGPLVLQLTDDDGDGLITACDVPDLVAVRSDDFNPPHASWLIALSGDDGRMLWTNPDSERQVDWEHEIAGGDIDGDGASEIVALTNDLHVRAHGPDGRVKWTSAQRVANVSGSVYTFLDLQIWDLDGDGHPEVVAGAMALDGRDGSVKWNLPSRNAHRDVVGDVDLDGQQEVLVGTLHGMFGWSAAMSVRADGSPGPAVPADFTGAGGLLQLDGDPEPELVYDAEDGYLRAVELGSVRPIFATPIPELVNGYPPVPCAADLDGDGRPEIVVPARSRIVSIHSDGTEAWSQPADDSSTDASCSIFDFLGDGLPEVVYRDQQSLRVLDGADGHVLWEVDVTSVTMFTAPVIADVDGDGSADIVVTGQEDYWLGTGLKGLLVFSNPAWRSARGVHQQLAWTVNHVEENGAIPAHPAPRWLTGNDLHAQVTGCGCRPLTVTLTTLAGCSGEVCLEATVDGATDVLNASWDWGDGTTSEGTLVPCHRYATPGTRTVTVRVVDGRTCKKMATIDVDAGPLAVELPPSAPCVSETSCMAVVVAGGTPPVQVTWDLGDGSPPLTGLTACHAWAAGDVTVTVTATDAAGCSSATSRVVHVVDPATLPEVSGPGAPPLRVARDAAGLVVEHESVRALVTIYGGSLMRLGRGAYDHVPVSACRSADGVARMPMPVADCYLLAVASACEVPVEGSHGTDSFGRRRPAAAPRELPACP